MGQCSVRNFLSKSGKENPDAITKIWQEIDAREIESAVCSGILTILLQFYIDKHVGRTESVCTKICKSGACGVDV